jgi:ceramide glucosyltransferase
MTVVAVPLVLLLAAGCAYSLFSLVCVVRFFRKEKGDVRSAAAEGPALPSVSILKPLKGLDPSSEENLLSFCTQDYPSFETLFGFRDEDDPALPLARRIAAAAGQASRESRVIVRRGGSGANSKALNLQVLAGEACCPLLAISDGDIRAGKDYLQRIVKEFQASQSTGMVTCLYKISAPESLGSALESYAIALDFIPSVLVAERMEGVRFGLGASMLVSKAALDSIGGFGPLRDYLADDYQLGFRLWKQGYTNILSRCVVENMVGAMSVRDHVSHQMRWSVTQRVSRPAGHLGAGITHVFPIALLLFIVAPGAWSIGVVGGALALRCAVAFAIYRKVIRTRTWLRWLFLLPLKDLFAFFFWTWGLVGSTVRWRGNRFRVLRSGKMERA